MLIFNQVFQRWLLILPKSGEFWRGFPGYIQPRNGWIISDQDPVQI